MKTKFQDRMFGTNVVDTNWIRGKLQSLYLPYFVLRLVDVVFIPFSKKQTCFCRTRIYVVRVVFVSLAFVMNYEPSRRRRVFLNEVKQKD